MHRHQALQGLEEKRLVAHDQVAALHQAQPQVARQVGVLKISLGVGAGRLQRQVGIFAGRAAAFQAVHQRAIRAGQALHPQRLKRLRKLARDRQAVFKQIAQAGRRLAALPYQPPVAVGAVRQVKGGNVQPHAADRFHAVHGPQVTRVALHQRRRQHAARQQPLWPVDVGQQVLQQLHALQHTGLDAQPLLGLDQQREQVQRPGALRSVFVGIDVVSDPVVANLALQAGIALVQISSSPGLALG